MILEVACHVIVSLVSWVEVYAHCHHVVCEVVNSLTRDCDFRASSDATYLGAKIIQRNACPEAVVDSSFVS